MNFYNLKLNKKIYILMGPPGVGKGTAAQFMKERYNFDIIAPGSVIRKYAGDLTECGRRILATIQKGEMLPDEVVNNLVWSELDQTVRSGTSDQIILDGYPRRVKQADFLFQQLFRLGIPKQNVLVLVMQFDKDVIVDRLSNRLICSNKDCQVTFSRKSLARQVGIATDYHCTKCNSLLVVRADDNREAILHRMSLYDAMLRDLLDYYFKEGIGVAFVESSKQDGLDELFKELSDRFGAVATTNMQVV